MKVEIPTKHIEDNLIFNHNGKVWAYYKIEGYSYDFLDFEQKKNPFNKQFAFLSNAGLDLHFLVVPNPTDITGILDETIAEMELKEYELKQNGITFINQVKEVLEEQTKQNESSEYYHYIGIQLDPEKNEYSAINPMIDMFTTVKEYFGGLSSAVYSAVGLQADDILQSVILAYKQQSNSIEASLGDTFSSVIKPATTSELVQISEKAFSVRNNNSDVSVREDFDFGEVVEGIDNDKKKHKAIRHRPTDFLEFQNTNVDPLYNAKLLKLSKVTEDNEIEELFTQHFVVSQMENVNWHPGFEWLYYIQLRLGFPITASIRIDNMPNEMIKKRLGNVKLELQDQKMEALKGGESSDLTVEASGVGVVQMEKHFQETGYPAHVCSFVIKITGETESELKTRGESLRNELSKFGVRIVAPYGEQFNIMYETIPGSNKVNNDYKMEVDTGIIAGLMFGSSTNIGDNRGFYIGHTSKFNKPVFVQPDLAAKAFEGLGNVVESISVLVAGMTGKGKSFFMNLFIYLSALTGSRGLIIDPKGDRTGWDKGLPYIGKEHIEVWTLGSDASDAGSLDPFRTSTSLEEGTELSLDILSFLTNVSIEDAGYSILSQAVDIVAKTEDPCIGAVITLLTDWYKNRPKEMTDNRYGALESVQNALESLSSSRLSSLLFGKVGQNFKVLDHKKTIQVLMIQNLNLPSENTKKTLPTHKISEAIMISITAWTKQYMMSDDKNTQHKFILQDEASAIERNETGSALMDHIVRQGRYWNTTLLKGSQNASDHGRDVANMGMKFSFGLRKSNEAEEMLNYLNLPVIEENVKRLMVLDRGEALFQDIYGRSAEIYINPVFRDLLDAFDSSTSTEEEREREKARTH